MQSPLAEFRQILERTLHRACSSASPTCSTGHQYGTGSFPVCRSAAGVAPHQVRVHHHRDIHRSGRAWGECGATNRTTEAETAKKHGHQHFRWISPGGGSVQAEWPETGPAEDQGRAFPGILSTSRDAK